MPELPEVETVARDLRRLIVGATITGATGDWPRAIASHASLATFSDAVAGRRVDAVGRRAKLVVVDLAGGAALTIHLKMTGQLFVVPAGAPSDRHVHLTFALGDGRELRFRDIRKFGRVGLWPRDPLSGAVLDAEDGGELFARHGPEPLDDAFTLRAFRTRLATQAAPARPGLHRRDRQHLRGRGALARPAPPVAPRRFAPSARRGAPLSRDAGRPGRGDRASRLVDRRLHGARWRRRDAGAPGGLPAGRSAVRALRAADPADRGRAAGNALLLLVPASPRGRSRRS